jgi:XTP/dITP diphosphohydrolase
MSLEEEEVILAKSSSDDLKQYEVKFEVVVAFLRRYPFTPAGLKRILPDISVESIPDTLTYHRARQLFDYYMTGLTELTTAQAAIRARRAHDPSTIRGVCVSVEKITWSVVELPTLLSCKAELISERVLIGGFVQTYQVIVNAHIEHIGGEKPVDMFFESEPTLVSKSDGDLMYKPLLISEQYVSQVEVTFNCYASGNHEACSCDFIVSAIDDVLPCVKMYRRNMDHSYKRSEMWWYWHRLLLKEVDDKRYLVRSPAYRPEVDLRFVTTSENKYQQVKALFENNRLAMQVTMRQEIMIVPEIQGTVEEVSFAKAKYAYDAVPWPPEAIIMVDDTALSITSCGGFPGVYVKSMMESMGKKALYDMARGDRRAQSVSVITIIGLDTSVAMSFRGELDGHLVWPPRGEGYGYDVMFEPSVQPEGMIKTYAEMTPYQQFELCPRVRALRKMYNYLRSRKKYWY